MTNKGTEKTFRYADIMAGYYFITQSNDINSRVWHYIKENYIPWEKGAEAMARHILDGELTFATKEQDGEQYAWLPDYNAYTRITDGERLVPYSEALEELAEACQVYLNSNEEREGMEMKSIKEQLIQLGMKPEEIDNHCSDLYVKKNTVSEKFVAEYEFKNIVKIFVDEIEHKIWYEIPFAYTEYYNNI